MTDAVGNPMSLDFTWSFTTATGSIVSYTIWSDSATPAITADSDTSAVELGVKFQSGVSGYITGLRFYKSPSNTGTHVGNLWTSTGTLLASVTFTNETASGWQRMPLATPVAITANTTYVASYHTNVGRYSADLNYFATSGFANPPLTALANSQSANGVYRYGSTSAFPNQTWNSTNYWVDVVFSPTLTADTTAPTVTAFVVPSTATSLTVPITTFTATDNVGVTGYLVNESSSVPSSSASGWLTTAPTSYTFASAGTKTLYAWAKDAAGNVSASRSATVTITLSDTTPPTVTSFTVPSTATTLTVPITALSATDNVAVTGYLVNESAATPSPSATGWSGTPQASYTFTTAGSKTLYAWARDAVGNVSASRSASVVITLPDGTPPTVTSSSPSNGATGVNTGTTVSVTFSEAMNPATITPTNFELRSASGALVSAGLTYNAGSNTATLAPTSPLGNSATYTARVKGGSGGVADMAGNPLGADFTWSFTTAAAVDAGPGGPILVIASPSNPFSRYYTEILRTEGFNAFAVVDIASVNSTLLAAYDVVILGEMTLTSGQVSLLDHLGQQWRQSHRHAPRQAACRPSRVDCQFFHTVGRVSPGGDFDRSGIGHRRGDHPVPWDRRLVQCERRLCLDPGDSLL